MAKFKRTELKLGEVWDYNYTYLKNLPDKELRQEYSRLRSIAQKRIKRLGESEWNWTNTYQVNKGGFPELSKITRRSDLIKELQQLGHFVYSKENSVTGMNEIREKSLERLELNGYDFVTKENWKEWTEFVEKYRKLWSKGSPTPEMLELREDFEASKDNPEKLAKLFEEWSQAIDEIQGPRV